MPDSKTAGATLDFRLELGRILLDVKEIVSRQKIGCPGLAANNFLLRQVNRLLETLRSGNMPAYSESARLFAIGGPVEEAAFGNGQTAKFQQIVARYEAIRLTMFARHLGPLAAGGKRLYPYLSPPHPVPYWQQDNHATWYSVMSAFSA